MYVHTTNILELELETENEFEKILHKVTELVPNFLCERNREG